MTCWTCPWARLSGTSRQRQVGKSHNRGEAIVELMAIPPASVATAAIFCCPRATAPRDVLLREVCGQHLNGRVAVEHDGAGDQFQAQVDRGTIRSRAFTARLNRMTDSGRSWENSFGKSIPTARPSREGLSGD